MAEPTLQVVKKLFAMSGNSCAFPGCQVLIVEKSGTVTGEICHIRAQNQNGPRYDANQTNKQRNGYENLILLCRNHHKIVDSEPERWGADALMEIKAIHEGILGREETDQDSFFAKKLLNVFKKITISNNTGNVMIDSPGAIQGSTIIKISKKKVSINPPPGSIGHDVNLSGYILHLIKRYNEFASSDSMRLKKFSHGAISKNIADNFGSNWRLLPSDEASDVISYLQQRISKTKQARINKGKGSKSYSTYDEYLKKYRK